MEPILNKFKSTDELARAYAELETAFTKKCQELAALRQKTAAAKTASEPAAEQKTQSDAARNAEADAARVSETAEATLPKDLLASETAEQTAATEMPATETAADGASLVDEDVSRFFAAYPAAKSDARALAELLAVADVIDYTAILAAYNTLLSQRVRAPEEWAEDEEFLARYVYPSERARAYFTQKFTQEPAAPKLMRSGAGMLTAPAKPATLADAALIARRML